MVDTKAQETSESLEVDELSQVKELLFGESYRAFQKELTALEGRMNEKFSSLNQRLEKDFLQCNQLIEKNLQDVIQRLESENESINQTQSQLQTIGDKLQSDIELVESSAKNDHQSLESHFIKELDAIDQLFSQRHKELLIKLEQVTRDLSESKTDRKTLAGLLSTMASNLATDQS